MAPKSCFNRLKKEMKAFLTSPPPHIPELFVNETNMTEWHFLMEGPPDTVYAGGWYVGKLRFPPDYPFKPPAIMMVTPSGRFETERRLCLSMSDFHPETWNPMWSLSTIMTGLLSFMLEDTATTGSIQTTDEEKKEYAAASLEWNLRHKQIPNMFPSLKEKAAQRDKGPEAAGSSATEADADKQGSCEAEISGVGEGEAATAGEAAPKPAGDPARPLPDERGERVPLSTDDVAMVRAAAQELREGEPEHASSRLDRAIKRAGGKPPAWMLVCKGRCLAQLGELEAAATLAALAVAMPPCQLAGLGMEDGIAFALLSDPRSSLQRWQAAAALKAKGNDAFRAKDYAAAREAYTAALEQEPSSAPLLSNLAAVESQLGNHGAATKAAEDALHLHRDYTKARRRLADSVMAAGDFERAAALYADLVKIGDESVRPVMLVCQKKAAA